MKNNYYAIDYAKFICSIFVVGIHVHAFEGHSNLYFWIQNLLFRIAVPFYFVVSSFLLEAKTEGNIQKKDLVHYSKNLLQLLLIFEPIALFLSVVIWYLQGRSFINIILHIIQSILFYPMGGLWFIQALIIGEWLAYILLKKKRLKTVLIYAVVMYFIGMLGNSYYFVVDGSIGFVVDLYLKIFKSFRNGFFVGFPFVILGKLVWICRRKLDNFQEKRESRIRTLGCYSDNYTTSNGKFISNIFPHIEILKWLEGGLRFKCIIVFLFSFVLYFGELVFIQNKNYNDDRSLYLMLPFCSFFLVLWLSLYTSDLQRTKKLRSLSTWIYLSHRDITYMITIFSLLSGVIVSWYVSFMITIVISVCSFGGYIYCRNIRCYGKNHMHNR